MVYKERVNPWIYPQAADCIFICFIGRHLDLDHVTGDDTDARKADLSLQMNLDTHRVCLVICSLFCNSVSFYLFCKNDHVYIWKAKKCKGSCNQSLCLCDRKAFMFTEQKFQWIYSGGTCICTCSLGFRAILSIVC